LDGTFHTLHSSRKLTGGSVPTAVRSRRAPPPRRAARVAAVRRAIARYYILASRTIFKSCSTLILQYTLYLDCGMSRVDTGSNRVRCTAWP